jgi:hypothetical protein
MKRFAIVVATALLMVGFAPTAAFSATSFNSAAAPSGTHVQTGTPTCSVSTTGVVTCPSYELAGVGNANASASLVANYTATVQCRNRGGQIVEVKSQVTGATATTGRIEPKNGRLLVPSLSSSPAPTASQFEASATCPNGNWTKETLAGSIALSSFTYTLSFVGYTGAYITITGP